METIETIMYNGCIIKIVPDYNPANPREYSHLGTMVCQHRRYQLGDVQTLEGIPDEKNRVTLPIYMYEHSEVALSHMSFIGRAHHAEWDSGQLGIIYATKEEIREWYGVKRITKQILAKVYRNFVWQIEEYSKYLNGDAYGYTIEKDGQFISSCYGFYSEEDAIQAAKEEIV